MGAGHSAEGEGGAYASDPPSERRKGNNKRRRHSVDSVASYSSQNHVDRIRTQNFSAASCHEDCDFGSIKTSLFRRSSSNLECHKRPESATSTSSTRSRLRELVERKSSQDDHKSAADAVGDIQYFENPTETLEFDKPRIAHELKKGTDERAKKRKLPKNKDKESGEKSKKQEKYQSKLAEYYKPPAQLPQDEFYQHLTRSKAAEDLLRKRFSNSDADFSGSYGRLCKHKESEGSNLRRSRSLAVIREETFTDLQIQNQGKNKRSQLIPRARLFDKPCFRDRLPGRAKYQTKEEVLENIYIDSTASCFGDINAQKESKTPVEHTDPKSDKEDTVSHRSRSISGSWPNLTDDIKLTNLSEDSIGHSRNPSEIDSLDSNYVRKHYNFEAHQKSNYKSSSPESSRSVLSVNDSKQLYITSDDHETDSETRDRSKNTTPKSFTNDSLSVTHSDNEILKCEPDQVGTDKNFYDEVTVETNEPDLEQRTNNNSKNSVHAPEIDAHSVISENDGSVSSPESVNSYISISIASSADKSHKLEYLANSLAEKIDEYCDTHFQETGSIASHALNSETNKEVDPIYTKVNKKRSFAEIRRNSLISKTSSNLSDIPKKINNEVYQYNSNLCDIPKKTTSEVYISNTYIESDDYQASNNQHHFSSKNINTEPFVTTLIENQYYSLPDINISKCLRKSERIDAQLREEDPEDITSENIYEIAQSDYRGIIPVNTNSNYGQLNKNHLNENNLKIHSSNIYLPNQSEPHIFQDFTKLEDDLKSIITIESSNADEKESSDYRGDNHQNEREINEIESTIRNTKLITKSESLKLANCAYRPSVNLVKSFSNDNIAKASLENKPRAAVRKHYSLRQREPTDNDIRLPSPSAFAQTFKQRENIYKAHQNREISKSSPLLSRVQSFKSSIESSISIVPLSGHQTIVINPPCEQNLEPNKSNISPKVNIPKLVNKSDSKFENKLLITEGNDSNNIHSQKQYSDTSNEDIIKDSFLNIKLNKVVRTSIPKLSEKIASTHLKFEKPPKRLIINENNKNKTESVKKNTSANMTRPQILQVVDSKSRKQSISSEEKVETSSVIKNMPSQDGLEKNRVGYTDLKIEFNVKEKLNNAIKTDIEYQEKLHSVKNYWSKLVDKSIDTSNTSKEHERCDSMTNQIENCDNFKKEIAVTDTKSDRSGSSLPEISVENIIKSIESVKIVDSIRKPSQPKTLLWKDESEKVKSDSEIEEATVQKIIKDCEKNACEDSKSMVDKQNKEQVVWTRDTPEIEIVELSSVDNKDQKTQATLIKAKGYEKGCDDFDHVRYKVMKSELFKNSMIANYRKEAQFDGLLQYLQDYSFQELLVNNNIVIIEPVRTKIDPPKKSMSSDACKIPPTLLKKSDNNSQVDKCKNAVRRHFFYHPIRVNKEIIEEELPNPDTVKNVRNLFEDTLKMKSPMTHDPPLVEELGLTRRATSYKSLNEESKAKSGIRKKLIRQLTIETKFGKWDNVSMSSGVSSGDLSSNNEYETDGLSPYSNKNIKENTYSSSDEYLCDSINHDFCCESQYVSPDIMKKIRDCGTSVTYYGGKVLNSRTGTNTSPMTKAIMEEIKGLQKNCSRDCYSCQTKCRGERCSCLLSETHKKVTPERQHKSSTSSDSGNHEQDKRSEGFPGFKFKLIKSNSCSSRLELTGTDEGKNSRLKFRKQNYKSDDPPLVCEDENSVKNKICRLESYNKGIVNTPFENKDDEETFQIPKFENKHTEVTRKTVAVAPQPNLTVNANKKVELQNRNKENISNTGAVIESQPAEHHSFEKKFYYVNENLNMPKASTGKFGEMVFEEFEVLESCYDSLNSNKSMK